MVALAVSKGDVLRHPCDLLVLKYANAFYGADKAVATGLGFNTHIPIGEYSFVQGKNLEASKVLYIGVGELEKFRYEQIRQFAHRALEVARRGGDKIRNICTTIHGPGYGLDESECFFSLIGGFLDAVEEGIQPVDLELIEIVESSESRAKRLASLLEQRLSIHHVRRQGEGGAVNLAMLSIASATDTTVVHHELASYGANSEYEPKLFVAMPFKDSFSDEWEIAIQEASTYAGVICERIGKQAYTGDVLAQVKKRISDYDGLLALLNESNPNVFLEIGFAWAKGKPTILIARDGNELPFDVRGQRCLIYKSINDLRTQLREELKSLTKLGSFKRRSNS